MSIQALYQKDFSSWTTANIEFLKNQEFKKLDVENLIEELLEMGRSEKREIINRLKILFCHFLKWEYQKAYQCKSWEMTIAEERKYIVKLIQANPSLKSKIIYKDFENAYQSGKVKASAETGFAIETFPIECPYDLDRLLNKELTGEF